MDINDINDVNEEEVVVSDREELLIQYLREHLSNLRDLSQQVSIVISRLEALRAIERMDRQEGTTVADAMCNEINTSEMEIR